MTDIFTQATKTQTALKAGILGFAGTGKTFTATMLAIGLSKRLNDGLPIAFFDTESGSDYLLDLIESEGLPRPLQAKTNAFVDLIAGTRQLASKSSILIVDSITAVWNELKESYKKKLKVGKFKFHHWDQIKGAWSDWPTLFLNSPLHIIICGRAGFEYDFKDDEEGDSELVKVGTKMKVESEFGFEPSLLLEMVRIRAGNEPGSGWLHQAVVLKDRTNTINGKVFAFNGGAYKKGDYLKVFKVFEPVLDKLAIGGTQLAVDSSRNSQAMFDGAGNSEWARRKQRAAVAEEEITGVLAAVYPGQDAKSKAIRQAILKDLFDTYSWSAIQAKPLELLETAVLVLKGFENAAGQELPDSAPAALTLLRSIAEPIPEPIPDQAF